MKTGPATTNRTITVTCEGGHTFRVKRKYAGRRGKCPECSATVLVPKANETHAAAGAGMQTVGEKRADDVRQSSQFNATQRLGRFDIESELGAGAFGTVYRAHDPQLDRTVALKVPRRGLLNGKQEAHRFLREARAAAGLHHPNIVPVYDAGEADDTYYIASAFVAPGHTLGDRLKEKEKPTFREAATLIEQLAGALGYAHGLGVVHRDIKPDNVLLDESGTPHVADFGLARREESAALRTQENVRMGTPAYMSPEQHAGKSREADGRADQWALGVILYEMMTGERPFQGNDIQLMYAVRESEPEAPRKNDRSIPRDLETICLKCLAKEPDKRYATCEDLAEDLRRWQNNEPITARRVTVAERLVRWSNRNPTIAALVACVVFITLAGLTGILWKWSEAEAHRQQAESFVMEASEQRDEAKQHAARALENAQRAETQRRLADERSAELAEKTKQLTGTTKQFQEALGAAEASRKEAEDHAKKIKSAIERATTERLRAEGAFYASQRNLYYSIILLAQQEETVGVLPYFHSLSNCPAEFRHWEWGYLTSSKRQTPIRTRDDKSILKRSTTAICCVSIDSDSGRILCGTKGGALQIFEGSEVQSWRAHVPMSCAEFHPAGKEIVSCGDDEIHLWNAETGARLRIFEGHTGDVHSVSYNSTGDRVVSGGDDKTVRWWDAATGKQLWSSAAHSNDVRSVAIRDDGKRIASVDGAELKLWDTETGETLHSISLPAKCVAFGRKDDWIAAGGTDGILYILKGKTCEMFHELAGHTGAITSISISSDGRRIVSAGDDRTIRLWEPESGTELLSIREHTDKVTSVAFGPNGRYIVSGSEDKTVRVWDAGSRFIARPVVAGTH